MLVRDITHMLGQLAPLDYSEGFDNTGLLVGDLNQSITGILVTLDTLESVVDEAIENHCNLIVSFHPIVFKGLKKITGKTYVERVVLKAIKNDISIFAIHTALDNSWNGVNAMICNKLGLTKQRVLLPQAATIKKLITFVPSAQVDTVRNALFDAGAGNIGNYENCSFNIQGKGSFQGTEDSNPTVGEKGKLHFEEEVQIGITFQKHAESKILQALFNSHPYEEVAYEITTLENHNQHLGMGMLGEFENPLSEDDFLKKLKSTFHSGVVKHSVKLGKPIQKVGVLGGSGSFAIEAAKSLQADAFVSADFKYHDFFTGENKILLTDIGHYESEQYTKELLVSYLSKKITNFAPAFNLGQVIESKVNTNPVHYL